MSEQIIYIVTSGEYSDYHIDAVFLDKESAEIYCTIHNGKENYDFCHIEEYSVSDVIKGNIEIYTAVSALFKQDGTVRIVETYFSEKREEKFEQWNSNYPYHLLFYTKKNATNKEIKKIARDKYAEYMAKEQGI